MRAQVIGIALVSAAAMTACTEEEAQRVISQLDGYDEALAKATAWGEENVVPVFDAEGATPIGDLPVVGEITHNGYIGGFEDGGDDTPINYLANLTLTYDFNTDAVTGRAFDYVTDVADFQTPAGEIDMTGGIVDAGGDAGLFFDGNGVLTGNGVSAEFWTNANGVFGGTDARVAGGDHITDVDWLTGAPAAGGDSISDGLWGVAE